MGDKKIIISQRSNLKGEDGYKTFSIRIKEDTAKNLDEIATRTHRFRNEIIGTFLEFAIENCVIEDKQPK